MINRLKTIFLCIIIEVMLIVCVGCANLHPTPLHYFFFYNILYGIVFSFFIPLFLLQKEKNMFDFIGFISIGKRQLIVWASFVIFSVGGQIISIVISEGIIP